MAGNDCWWWLEGILQEAARPPAPPARRRTHDIAVGAALTLMIVVSGAVTVKVWSRLAAHRERTAAQVEATTALVAAMAHGCYGLGDRHDDIWGTPLRVKESKGVWDTIVVTSAGPDLTFGTSDDISEKRSSPLNLNRVGERVGKGVGDFGVGTVKGLYRSAKDHLVGPKQKEEPHAHADAGPDEGTDP